MTPQILILLGVATSALAVEYWFLSKFYDRWRLREVILFGAVANGSAWGLGIGIPLWLRMKHWDEAALISPVHWYTYFLDISFLSMFLTLAGLLPAGIVAIVYHRRRIKAGAPVA